MLVLFIVATIFGQAWPAIKTHGVGFISGTTWDANTGEYGIGPEIWGTMFSSILALAVGMLFGVAVAVFLSEGFLGGFVFNGLKLLRIEHHPFWGRLPGQCEHLLKNLVELLAAIPSVVYGLWGIFVVIPLIRPACNWMHERFADVP
ncbi:MAG: hypothetical protein AAF492_28815, partial [Verrucomicrobiota bacterium]